jgi:hypothetical protein
MTPKKPDWFEMTEGDTPATGLRKVNKTLPIGALLVAGALLFGGSLFAQDQSADSNIASSSVQTTDSALQFRAAVQQKLPPLLRQL